MVRGIDLDEISNLLSRHEVSGHITVSSFTDLRKLIASAARTYDVGIFNAVMNGDQLMSIGKYSTEENFNVLLVKSNVSTTIIYSVSKCTHPSIKDDINALMTFDNVMYITINKQSLDFKLDALLYYQLECSGKLPKLTMRFKPCTTTAISFNSGTSCELYDEITLHSYKALELANKLKRYFRYTGKQFDIIDGVFVVYQLNLVINKTFFAQCPVNKVKLLDNKLYCGDSFYTELTNFEVKLVAKLLASTVSKELECLIKLLEDRGFKVNQNED